MGPQKPQVVSSYEWRPCVARAWRHAEALWSAFSARRGWEVEYGAPWVLLP